VRGLERAESPGIAIPGLESGEKKFTRFGAWAFVRLLLMMTFSAVSVVGIGHLAAPLAEPGARAATAHDVTADYAMPYRIAQLLAYVAVTVWASTYGIAARAWSHGQVRRARVQMLRVGKWGTVGLTVIAIGLLMGRGILASIESEYAQAIATLLPPLLGVFIWYGLLAFCCAYADLHETPQRGALFWGAAVMVQVVMLCLGLGGPDAKQEMIAACACGTGFALLVLAPAVLWRPFRMSATGVPLALMAIAPASLFAPAWVVDGLAIPVMLGGVGFLWMSGLLVRPVDRRAWRRWRGKTAATKTRSHEDTKDHEEEELN